MKLRTLVGPTCLVPIAFLSYWLAFTYENMSRALFRTWFFSSGEYVLAAEIIRFSNLDFRQHFFAYPVGKLIDWLSPRLRHGDLWTTAALALGLFGCFHSLAPGPEGAGANAMGTEPRLHNIERATAWIKTNAEPKAFVAVSYFCSNPDTFCTWLRWLEVPAPASVFDGRDYIIWWGHARALPTRMHDSGEWLLLARERAGSICSVSTTVEAGRV